MDCVLKLKLDLGRLYSLVVLVYCVLGIRYCNRPISLCNHGRVTRFSLFRSLYSCLCCLDSFVLRNTSRLET
ncbi:hypothetical protein PILCRDRAFT_190112 [Piloderma croceum F 1598]|uniref:Uncharacterized protein n=1 Tax=Piloderma croceum (strain F 1598) TaxID=765440 RepID=A0A0C3GIZ9_PILCF|nr:hypothetical protein PILCRDRAFT_190112 [Piloderma croceum F 1598]